MAIISIPTAVGGVALPGQLGQLANGPLAALFGGNGLTTFNYPTELSTDATKTHYVQFSIKEVVPANVADENQGASLAVPGKGTVNAIAAGAAAIAPTTTAIAGQAASSISSFVSNAASAASNLLPSSVTNLAGGVGQLASGLSKSISSANQQTGIAITPPVKKLKSVISLYMPDTLNSTYSANYGEVSLQKELGGLVNGLRSIDQIAKTTTDAIRSNKSVGSAISSDPNVIDTVIKGVSGLAGGGDRLGDILLQGQGYAINPQMQMIYEGLPMRSFSLSFVFTPKSQQEARNVDQIIYTFKYYAAPSLTSGATVSSQSMYLTPPAIFNVKFFIKGQENKFLPKYADCVLETIEVNHAPNGFAAHTDGAPVQTTLSLQFKEIEIVDRARLQAGYNNSNSPNGLR